MPRKKALADLERSGITRQDARKMKIEVYNREDSAELDLSLQAEGYKIPYLDEHGQDTGFFRYRLLEDVRKGFARLTGARALKYLQPPKTLPEVYLPPFADWSEILPSKATLTITEGEKKAAAATLAGIPTLGLGGVWSFQSSKAGVQLIDGLDTIPWDRRVNIVFDSDAAANEDVRLAATRLATLLTQRGAEVYLGYLPAEPGAKVGLDDYLLTHTPEELTEWLAALEAMEDSVALHAMNERVTYVYEPGLVVVNSTGQQITPSAFRDHAFAPYTHVIRVERESGTSLKQVRTATEWLRWPARAAVQRMVYEPGQPKYFDGNLNLWTGYSVEPAKGDIRPWTELLDFLFDGEDEGRRWFEKWAAYPFQHPGTKLTQAVLLWGPCRGTGKSLTAYTLGDLYGENFAHIRDRDFNGSFNSWAYRKQLVFYDEVSPSGSRERANLLKAMVTQESIEINIKYLPQFEVRDCINYFLASNHGDALYIEPGERRYFIHEVKARSPLPRAFYNDYSAWRKSEAGRAALLYHLLTLDLEGFETHGAAPKTAAFERMVGSTRTELEVFLEEVFDFPDEVSDRLGGGDLVSLPDLHFLFDPADGRKPANTLLARKLQQMGREPVAQRFRVGNQRTSVYAIRNEEAWQDAPPNKIRAHYEKYRTQRKGP